MGEILIEKEYENNNESWNPFTKAKPANRVLYQISVHFFFSGEIWIMAFRCYLHFQTGLLCWIFVINCMDTRVMASASEVERPLAQNCVYTWVNENENLPPHATVTHTYLQNHNQPTLCEPFNGPTWLQLVLDESLPWWEYL